MCVFYPLGRQREQQFRCVCVCVCRLDAVNQRTGEVNAVT